MVCKQVERIACRICVCFYVVLLGKIVGEFDNLPEAVDFARIMEVRNERQAEDTKGAAEAQ